MTKKQKDFIAKAKPRTSTKFKCLYIADKGTLYGGFWGKNGYNNMVIIGQNADDEYELIADYSDVVWIREIGDVNIDIANKNGMMRLWSSGKMLDLTHALSACTFEGEKKVRVKND